MGGRLPPMMSPGTVDVSRNAVGDSVGRKNSRALCGGRKRRTFRKFGIHLSRRKLVPTSFSRAAAVRTLATSRSAARRHSKHLLRRKHG